MSDKPRRWFQIHLSTAIALMFVAGGLMWLNFGWLRTDFGSAEAYSRFTHGWPVEGVRQGDRYYIFVRDTRVLGAGITVYNHFELGVIADWILPDVLPALGILFAAGCLLETRIRRREACRP